MLTPDGVGMDIHDLGYDLRREHFVWLAIHNHCFPPWTITRQNYDALLTLLLGLQMAVA